MKSIKIGIATFDQTKDRLMRIARGEHKPTADKPKIWFNSLLSAARVLSKPNLELLAVIARAHPETLTELAKLTGRAPPNVSRTMRTLAKHGIVKLVRGPRNTVRPQLLVKRATLEIPLAA